MAVLAKGRTESAGGVRGGAKAEGRRRQRDMEADMKDAPRPQWYVTASLMRIRRWWQASWASGPTIEEVSALSDAGCNVVGDSGLAVVPFLLNGWATCPRMHSKAHVQCLLGCAAGSLACPLLCAAISRALLRPRRALTACGSSGRATVREERRAAWRSRQSHTTVSAHGSASETHSGSSWALRAKAIFRERAPTVRIVAPWRDAIAGRMPAWSGVVTSVRAQTSRGHRRDRAHGPRKREH